MFEKNMKEIDVWDVSLIKTSVLLSTLFLVTVWPAFLNLVLKAHWGWYLGLSILVMLRPGYRFWFKK